MAVEFSILEAAGATLLSEMQRHSYDGDVDQIWTEKEMSTLLQGAGVAALLVTDADGPKGFLLYRQVLDEAEIQSFCVLPTVRKRGLGRSLLMEFCCRMRQAGIREIFLEVRANNDAALRLYKRAGFEEVGQRKNYYDGKDGEKRDALVMKVEL